MGLHICYELGLPRDTSKDRVLSVLGALRDRARAIPFDEVTEIREFEGEGCEVGTGPGLWYDVWAIFRCAAEDLAGPASDLHVCRHVRADYATGFVVLPGRRCEPAGFGLCRLPETVVVDGETLPVLHPGWHWHYCCKTQYASVVSDEHLLRCHLGLIRLLDEAREVGLDVTVRDETGYHEHRDERRLLEEVHKMNRIVARIAGAFSDALDPTAPRAESPIFEHKDFEHLEGG